ncbi:hypothetical protein HOP50_02g12780 [Chloropicon primus]|uniref:Uncharacterized protein n=1 Tax=Chloropicon primus TaxID=1764295 RepID=A0A5B8MF36_9CHLO|nr:hypothetical protein A3770_02p12920 [Chloropicon primus]UPQ97981.1 hypothetical protein HOP50_02g12780 [Chloropicon primus]|eukprot:QDZ18774.1 hypothetical protein A3770_02p12920 [Chloropicon primus]
MTQNSMDPLQETRKVAAAALLEKESENPEVMYQELFPSLLNVDENGDKGSNQESSSDDARGLSLVPVAESESADRLAAFEGGALGGFPYPEQPGPRLALVKRSESQDGAEGSIVDVASATPLKDQWRTFHTEGKLLSWKRRCGKETMGLAFRSWLLQTPLVSEFADKLQGSTYYELVYHVKRRKYESFKTWFLVVEGLRTMNRLGLLRWRLGLQKKVFLAWSDYVLGYVRRKTRNDRRSVVHRVRLHLKMKQHYFAKWQNEAFRTYRLSGLEKNFVVRRNMAKLGGHFKRWRVVTLILLYSRKKKSLQTVVTWKWLTKYTSLYTESEGRIQELEKECNRLYDWEQKTCNELKEAAAALERGDANQVKLEKELSDAKQDAIRSKQEGFLQAMEASRNLLPNVSKNISMLSLAHLDLKSNVQNELDVCREQITYFFKAIANKMYAQQSKTDEKFKSLKNYYEKNIVMILSMLRDDDTEKKMLEEGWKLNEVLPVILEEISKLQEVKDDADAALNARQIQLDILTKNSDETIQSLREAGDEAREALTKANKNIDELKGAKYANEKELEQLQTEIQSQKKVYDMLYKKHTDLSEHFVQTSEKSNKEMSDILKLKEDEIKTLEESCDGLRKRMDEQQTGHNQETTLLHEMTNDLQENLEAALSDLAKSKRHAEELNIKYMSYDLDIEKEQLKVQDLDERYTKVYDELQTTIKEKLELKAKLDKYVENNMELTNTKSSFEDTLAEKESKLEEIRQQNTELEAHKENYVTEIRELKAEIQALHESVSVRSNKLQDVEQAKMELITNAMVYEEEISSLKADKEALQDSIAKKNSKLSDLEQQKSELESLVDGYLENNVELNNEMESLNQSLAKKKVKIEEMNKVKAGLESATEAQKEELKAVKETNAQLQQSLEKQAKRLEDRDTGMSEKASQLEDLHRKLAEYQEKIESQSDQIKTLMSDKDKLKETIERRGVQVQNKDAEVSEKALQVSKLEGRVEAQTEEIRSLKAEKDKLQQAVDKKAKKLQNLGNLEGAHADLEATIENQNDEIDQLKSERDRLVAMNDKRAIQLKAKDSDIAGRLSQLDEMERNVSKLQSAVDTQKSEVRILRSENERLQKRTEQLDEAKERSENQELELKELKADMKELEKVKGNFVKYKGLLSIIYDKITNKQFDKLMEVESDIKEFTCVLRHLSSLQSENRDLVKELEEMKLLTRKLKELQSIKKKKKRETSSVQAFKALNRRASFVPTQLPTQVWADETNRPKVSDLVNANEELLNKIEQKVKTKGGPITNMVSIYIMRKAFAVWLQAVGSEKALERLKVAGAIDAGAAFASLAIPEGVEE